jgi:signal transduction histidine kinase
VIFEPLVMAGGVKNRGSSGLGLGLYITQQIALAHGGRIEVDSSPAAGTRFRVELPRTPPARPSTPSDAERPFVAERS